MGVSGNVCRHCGHQSTARSGGWKSGSDAIRGLQGGICTVKVESVAGRKKWRMLTGILMKKNGGDGMLKNGKRYTAPSVGDFPHFRGSLSLARLHQVRHGEAGLWDLASHLRVWV